MSREELKKKANDLILRCKEENIRLPNDDKKALMQAIMMLNATKEDGKLNLGEAFKAIKEKFGSSEKVKEKKIEGHQKRKVTNEENISNKKGTNSKDEKYIIIDEKENNDELEDKKIKKKSKTVIKENQNLTDEFSELAAFCFKNEEKFKGGTYSKVAKAIREFDEIIKNGKQLLKIKGVGKKSAEKIDEFLNTGKILLLEKYREGIE